LLPVASAQLHVIRQLDQRRRRGSRGVGADLGGRHHRGGVLVGRRLLDRGEEREEGPASADDVAGKRRKAVGKPLQTDSDVGPHVHCTVQVGDSQKQDSGSGSHIHPKQTEELKRRLKRSVSE
jgi:hypothetical protein